MNTLIYLSTMIWTGNRVDELIHDYANKWLFSIFLLFPLKSGCTKYKWQRSAGLTNVFGMLEVSESFSTDKSSESGYSKGPNITGTRSNGKSVKFMNSNYQDWMSVKEMYTCRRNRQRLTDGKFNDIYNPFHICKTNSSLVFNSQGHHSFQI